MHSSSTRFQNIFSFFTTVAFTVAGVIALSSFVFPTHTTATGSIRTVQIAPGRQNQYGTLGRRQEFAHIKFDLHTDLTPLFHYNTKQVFLYLTTTYPGDSNKYANNTVIIWDKIVPNNAKSKTKLALKNQRAKYPFNDISGKFASGDRKAELRLEYNIQPHVGALVWGTIKDADTGSNILADFVLEDTAKAIKSKKSGKAKADAEATKARETLKEDL
ncbi:signal peptidase 22 kDa subunit [Ascobolus immersus RN42]|uniref:Signal peptidase subunit 3 n=1 Tax=Ascobolus immersus RN42 TaxID=1160509 RepID=A0A3N4IBY5_ASCIM|nr:signal peptidase 22 kDa subunit [Ascobolus immersus RN42]